MLSRIKRFFVSLFTNKKPVRGKRNMTLSYNLITDKIEFVEVDESFESWYKETQKYLLESSST